MIGLHDILAKSYTHAKEAWGWNSQLFRRSPTPNQCAGLRAPAWVGFHRYGPMSQTPSQWHGSLLPVPSPKVSHRKLPKKTCSRASACMIIIIFCWLATLSSAASYRILLADISSEQDMRQCVNHHAEGTHACDHAESQQVLWAVLFRE